MTQFLGFSDYRQPGKRLAKALARPYQEVNIHRFPDGEHRLSLPLPVAETLIVCRSLFNPNEKLIDLLLLARTAREHGVRELILVAPYLCYMRQDKAFHPGEAVSQKVIGHLLADMFDVVITVDPHMHRTPVLAEAVPASQAIALTAAEPIAKTISEKLKNSGDNWLLVGPDEESEQWVSSIAKLCHCPYIIGKKERYGDRDVRIQMPSFDPDLRIALIDDVISTGRTLAEATRYFLGHGATEVQCFATHLLPRTGAIASLAAAGASKVTCTDSIANKRGNIHLASLLADTLSKLSRP